ncbi:hypothetical protein PLEOSDRAFT_1098962 [Pleurotus ostreatus PC15]|uniref:Uncharacterized protein n=1 Tax=Pleurotus ostreatus (strain PC15) TaxID=1137138 RepID=A0A067P983_PLEO1|nr:hypothetical protein PLEOSDRAFT_1098962 [Pleurotus ostreatus PC15]
MHRQSLTYLARAGRGSRKEHRPVVPKRAQAHTTAMPLESIEEATLPPIFDIFDAPHRLGESKLYGNASPSGSTSPQKYSSSMISLDNPFCDPMPLPSSLPPPIIFDGPARPRHPALEYASRARRSSSVRPYSMSTPSVTMSPADKPMVQLFEGPARIHRHAHHGPSSGQKQISYKSVMAGVAGLFGCITVAKNSEEKQRRR